MTKLPLEPLTSQTFAPFGQVIHAPNSNGHARIVNQGSARRFDQIATVRNERPNDAALNIALFVAAPRTMPFDVRSLEKHPFSSQLFSPMNATRYIVVVASGLEAPVSLRAFLAEGTMGVCYAPGVWHHTLMALDKETHFVCAVWENGTAGDCVEATLSAALRVDEPL